MTLADVTRAAVEAAIEQFDGLGRDQFLRRAGFGRARAYYLAHNGKLYDSKAIAGYAHGLSTGTPLRPEHFSGGDKTVALRLRMLDFTVRYLPNPDWTRDEIILACMLVEAHGWRQLDEGDSRVIELSRELQSPAIHPVSERGPDFRNPAGVARKTADIATRHPSYKGRPTNGNRLDREVLDDFLADPGEMHRLAKEIRAALADDAIIQTPTVDLDLAWLVGDEGGILYRRHLQRERNPRLRSSKIAEAKRRGQPIACEVCGFDFFHAYGQRGLDYIECHHRVPLHVSGPTKTRTADLALLCSNCHRMIHRSTPWLTVEELKDLTRR